MIVAAGNGGGNSTVTFTKGSGTATVSIFAYAGNTVTINASGSGAGSTRLSIVDGAWSASQGGGMTVNYTNLSACAFGICQFTLEIFGGDPGRKPLKRLRNLPETSETGRGKIRRHHG
ncbi:MAG: hypothetical protein LRY51_16040 [Geovibrio sp.]|nr:hypothetical protein [Geovibrio sp.]